MPTIRRLADGEWRAYRDLRLQALRDSPDAFGSTLEAEEVRSDAEWAERVSTGATSEWNLPLVADERGALVGMAWGRIDPTVPETAHVYQMWVAPRIRGQGCGLMLLDRVVAWARDKGAREVALCVTSGDRPAMRLYSRAGFKSVGDPGPLRPGSTLLAQTMRLDLGSGAA